MDSKTTWTLVLTLIWVAFLSELAQTKVIDPEYGMQEKVKETTEEPTHPPTKNTTELQLHVQIETSTPHPTLESIVLIPHKPERRSKARRYTAMRKCCKAGEWAGMRGYFCNFDRMYYREFRNMEHRKKMKFQGRDVVPYVDMQVVRRIRRCVDNGYKTFTSRCCRNYVISTYSPYPR